MPPTFISAATAATRGPGNQISILDGIRKRVGDSAKVLYAEGCKITTGKQGWSAWYENKVEAA